MLTVLPEVVCDADVVVWLAAPLEAPDEWW